MNRRGQFHRLRHRNEQADPARNFASISDAIEDAAASKSGHGQLDGYRIKSCFARQAVNKSTRLQEPTPGKECLQPIKNRLGVGIKLHACWSANFRIVIISMAPS